MNAPVQQTGAADRAAALAEEPSSTHSAWDSGLNAENPVHELHRTLETVFASRAREAVVDVSPFAACLTPLLERIGWCDDARRLHEALPHLAPIGDIDTLRAVLSRLDFATDCHELRLSELTYSFVPCIFTTCDDNAMVVLSIEPDGRLFVFDGRQRKVRLQEADRTRGTIYVVYKANREAERNELGKFGFFNRLFSNFRGLFLSIMGVTLMINMISILVSIYVMAVYDKVIPSKSLDTLLYLAAGLATVASLDFALRQIRARALAFFGARVDALVSMSTFGQLTDLPVQMTESATIGAQIMRLKQFEGARGMFTGAIAPTLLDLPFTGIFLLAIFIIGGDLVWIPISLMAVYAVMALATVPTTRQLIVRTGAARAKQHAFLVEMVSKQRAIKEAAAEQTWLERYCELAGDFAINQFRAQQFNTMVGAVAQALVVLAGATTMIVGTLMVIERDLSIGALIAVMAFVWRVLSPIQASFLGLTSLNQIQQSIRQVNALMRLPTERSTASAIFHRRLKGEIVINRVGFRYTPRQEPVLNAASLAVRPGQIIAITGPSGAGKSTLLKLIARLYLPQAGMIAIDGHDIRQLDLPELRHAISFVPQKADFFYGTIEQNLRLASPTASWQDMERAFEEAGLMDYADRLPLGLRTHLSEGELERMPDWLKQRVNLARAYLKDAPIYLLDEPAQHLDTAGDEMLMRKLESLRGKRTVLLTTHRPSHMRLADRLIYLGRGQILADGPPADILPQILKAG